MFQSNKIESAYNFLLPLFISGACFLLSFYFCLLSVPLYSYTLPFYAGSLLISLFLFYRIDKQLNALIKKRKNTIALYNFYHNCIGIYLILSILLFGVSVAYIPFYYNGGSIFVWYCAPLSFLCLISFVQSYKRKKRIKKQNRRKQHKYRTLSSQSPNLTLIMGKKKAR